jgi:hypothetical protein
MNMVKGLALFKIRKVTLAVEAHLTRIISNGVLQKTLMAGDNRFRTEFFHLKFRTSIVLFL